MAKHLETIELPLPARIKRVRSNLKRSLSLLRLAPEPLQREAERAGERIRAVRRNLREARDSQALNEALNRLKPGHRTERRAADLALMAVWRSLLRSRQISAIKRVAEGRMAKEAGTLRRLATAIPSARSIEDACIAHRFRRDYRRARRRVAAASDGRPGDLHRLRCAVVDHRYQLQLLYPDARSRLKKVEELRRVLGTFQDLEMLREAVRDTPEGPDPRRLLKLIRRRQSKRLRGAAKLTDQLFSTPARRVFRADQERSGGD